MTQEDKSPFKGVRAEININEWCIRGNDDYMQDYLLKIGDKTFTRQDNPELIEELAHRWNAYEEIKHRQMKFSEFIKEVRVSQISELESMANRLAAGFTPEESQADIFYQHFGNACGAALAAATRDSIKEDVETFTGSMETLKRISLLRVHNDRKDTDK